MNVRFGGISGEFGRAMVRILARRSRAKIPMARPNEPDMPTKRTKKVRLGIYLKDKIIISSLLYHWFASQTSYFRINLASIFYSPIKTIFQP